MQNYGKKLFAALLSAACCWLNGEPLPLDVNQLQTKAGAKASLDASQSILLRFNNPEWDAGLILNPPKGKKWNLSAGKFLAVDVKNLSESRQLRLTMHVSSGGREEKNLHETNTGIALNPGEQRTMRLFLPHRDIYQAPQGGHGMRTLDTAGINAIVFQMQWPFEPETRDLTYCKLSNLRLEGEPDRGAAVGGDKYFPFIDCYGQNIHADWPEKIKKDEDLQQKRQAELKELAATGAPSEWNEYGGWKNGPQLEASGNFRTQKYQDKWFLVDPSGRLFWSTGIDVVRLHTDATTVKDPRWFASPAGKGDVLPFTDWNLRKKYGKDDYQNEFFNLTLQRLKAWGINTIGNWSANEIMLSGKMPYTLQLTDFNRKFPTFARSNNKVKFYDVFDPEFAAQMGNILRDRIAADPATAKSIGDPMCIGYFIDNELEFDKLGAAIVKASLGQPAKIEWVKDIRAKYGDIGKLNAAWGTRFSTWDDIAANDKDAGTEAYQQDKKAFYAKFVDRYYEICRQGVKSVAPHRLYLGSRLVGFSSGRQSADVWKAAARHCDVISVNVYAAGMSNCNARLFGGKPVIIGEFHFGIIDRGMFSASLCPAGSTQADRAVAYQRFVQGALAHPDFVGAHWFQFRDQPLTGRWDGEGYQIGFVDVADTPYPELAGAAREVGENMYQYRMNGKLNNNMK